ncbi:MAG: PKD domain-containing protein, partial [Bacteroidota bacterium]|nr:PKD domain-containing protein [Bacteroidota bacterium]
EVGAITVDKTSGDLPFKVSARINAKDPDNDKLTYTWDFGNGKKINTTEPVADYTFTNAGDYSISVEVKDDKNASTKSDVVNVYAGNEAPTVNIAIDGNKSFYFPGQQVKYNVTIDDKDDTAKVKDLNNLIVSADYAEGTDKAGSSTGHQVLSNTVMGKNLMMSLDCKGCHKVDEKSIGPAFTMVAKRYQKDPKAPAYLAQKIISGGSGKWGEVAMAAHPNLKVDDAQQIVAWVLSLANEAKKEKSLPPNGAVNATLNKPVKSNGLLYISASYTDKGGNNIKPLSGSNAVVLRNNKVTFEGVTNMQAFTKGTFGGITYMLLPQNTGWFSIDSIDLTGISRAALTMGWQAPPSIGYTFEVHLDSPDGNKLGEFSYSPKGGSSAPGAASSAPKMTTLAGNITKVSDGKLHSVYIVSKAADPKAAGTAALVSLEFLQK